jgi:hypothetical protein
MLGIVVDRLPSRTRFHEFAATIGVAIVMGKVGGGDINS